MAPFASPVALFQTPLPEAIYEHDSRSLVLRHNDFAHNVVASVPERNFDFTTFLVTLSLLLKRRVSSALMRSRHSPVW